MRPQASLALLTLVSLPAAQDNFAEWYPIPPGTSWKYQNTVVAADFAYWDVLIPYPFGGDPLARKVGTNVDECIIASNDGQAFRILGAVGAGNELDFPDVVLGQVDDGFSFSFSVGDFSVLRRWDALDPVLLDSVDSYGVDPALPDAYVWVWYNTFFPPNEQNAIVESGPGGVAYPWAVTDLEWFQRDLGPVFFRGVEEGAGSDPPGTLTELYVVEPSFDCNGNGVQDHLDLSSGGSLDCNANEVPDECEEALEEQRLGAPPNPAALLPGVTSGPVLGATWDPVVSHATFVPNAVADLLGVSVGTLNVPTPIGTLLCDVPAPGAVFSTTPGAPFAVALPPDCALLGASLCAQAASVDPFGALALTNALDLVLGGF
ncbi:MAG: hypothetical protein AAF682_29450 [Planctomycetota bacterium]